MSGPLQKPRIREDGLAANVVPIIEQIKASGATSFQAIAEALNARGIRTARDGAW